ncbi:MBL fold metallo-hydrolase [Vibrio harveyi]|uniref:ComEC/Rec2 family competence protein n=1 Tax=Vibrio TaxID=662 RepID=UPI0022CDBA1F|nr:MBL fold metallo-hydrolase [Vibrio sp. NFR]ELI0637185.1 MBL fold metallo-hydrolase [Vibrio harveyi]MDA0134731.1 MBL fold metallo-hydrolase [Vibrio sp. NFR]
MEFRALRALQGDAFIIKAGDKSILVDGGMPSTYGQIADWLDDNLLNAALITHVDYDHLGGLFNWFTDRDSDLSSCEFFMNHPEFPCEYQGEEVGYKHGHSLKDLLSKRGLSFHQLTTNQELNYGDLKILVLSPDESVVEMLYKDWGTNIVYDDGVLKYKKAQTQSGDIINKSSLILLVSCNNTQILMLGDSHCDVASTSLRNQGYSIGAPLPLAMVKLSHHGSQHNTSAELLQLIDCENYYISTNGGRYDHPDEETILLLQQRAAELSTCFNVYLNYEIALDIQNKCNFPLNNLNFIEQCSVELK